MTIAEFRAEAERVLTMDAHGSVRVVMRGHWGSTRVKRAWRGGPIGRIVAEVVRGGQACVVVDFAAAELLTAIDPAPARRQR